MSLGPDVVVECQGKRYKVSRHYIALHGLKAMELESLLAKGIIQVAP
jgi:hypothetical protein